MFHFGFSYVGLIYLFMLFIPNIIWTKNQPEDYEKYVQNENKFLQIMERIGEVLVCCFVLIFSDFNIRFNSMWCIWLLLSFMLMILYEIYWIKYYITGMCILFTWCIWKQCIPYGFDNHFRNWPYWYSSESLQKNFRRRKEEKYFVSYYEMGYKYYFFTSFGHGYCDYRM